VILPPRLFSPSIATTILLFRVAINDIDLDKLIVELGQEFKRRGMDAHLQLLRALWRERQGRASNSAWPIDMALNWMALFRLPPFDRVYPLLPGLSPCPSCPPGGQRGIADHWVTAVWPGGTRIECSQCHTAWLNVDGPQGS